MVDVENMLRCLSSADDTMDRNVIEPLVALGPEAVDALIPFLDSEDTTLCAMAALALGMLYPEERYSTVAEVLRGPSREVRAMWGACKRALPHLEAMAERGDVRLTLHACDTMLTIGDRDGYVAFWLAWALGDADMKNRLHALEMLERMQKNAAPAVSALVKCLGDDDKKVALQSAWVLAELGKAASEAIPLLESWLKLDDQRMRAVGACAIARIWKSASVLPMLIDAMLQGDEYCRCYAALGCMPLGPLAAPAVPGLIAVIEDGLRDPNSLSRHHAIMALEDIGPGAAPAAGVLAKFLDALNGNTDVMLLSDGSAACCSLAAMGPGGREAIPELRNCLNWGPEDNEWLRLTRLAASEALFRITGSTLPALTVASEMLADEFTAYDAVDLLGKLGSAGRSAVPDLQRLLEHDDEFLRDRARRALAKIMADGTL